MNSLKSIAKGGWHPEKSSSSSSRSSGSGDNERFKNFKGLQQVANWTGHGSKGGSNEPTITTARPLSALKDPASFGAPPKRDPKAPLPPPTQPGILEGTPPPTPQPQPQEEEPPRPRSYQVNTTGLSTAGLPAPPKRALGTVGSPPTSPGSTAGRAPPPLPGRSQPPPLPGRQSSSSVSSQEAPPPFPTVTSYGITPSTAAASSRLAQAGVSVPGFNIGGPRPESTSPPLPGRSKPAPPARSPAPQELDSAPAPTQPSYSIGELSSRFSSLKTHSNAPASTAAEPPSAGTSWSQKQAALRTASQIRKDPTSVSLSDATSVAKTMDNFRQRHGDQIVEGYQRAEAAGIVNSPGGSSHSEPQPSPRAKWGDLASRASKTASTYSTHSNSTDGGLSEGASTLASVAAKKKPPPPPKPKPHNLEGAAVPPPIPLGTKPK
ncbi:hypothetical protein ABW19_dt0204240 [Dactylella cylindrospora]|nr:hypothetical protein ABW19_dt0204240 [Dactylella cylindrospora]